MGLPGRRHDVAWQALANALLAVNRHEKGDPLVAFLSS